MCVCVCDVFPAASGDCGGNGDGGGVGGGGCVAFGSSGGGGGSNSGWSPSEGGAGGGAGPLRNTRSSYRTVPVPSAGSTSTSTRLTPTRNEIAGEDPLPRSMLQCLGKGFDLAFPAHARCSVLASTLSAFTRHTITGAGIDASAVTDIDLT